MTSLLSSAYAGEQLVFLPLRTVITGDAGLAALMILGVGTERRPAEPAAARG